MKGMSMNCVMGPIRNAVMGDAAVSMLCAKPNTRPWRSSGTTFWTIVCSVASMNGTISVHTRVPAASRRIDGCIGKISVATHMMMFTINRVLSGFFPSPLRVM
jgi:hypothetical protein